jgi:S1-C subfamily serine protease
MKKCLNCGYERQPDDDRHGIIPSTECPRCRAIYEKAIEKAKIESVSDSRIDSRHTSEKKTLLSDVVKKPDGFFDSKLKNAVILVIIAGITVSVFSYFMDSKPSKKIISQSKITAEEKTPQTSEKADNPVVTPPETTISPQTDEVSSDKQKDQTPAVVTLAREITPSVVKLTVKKDDMASGGSGFFITNDGYFITNYHVLGRATAANILMEDGSIYPVTAIIDEDEKHDLVLAFVKLPNVVKPISLAKARPQVGERVVVFGSPDGLEKTVSSGIVSAIRPHPGDPKRGDVIQMTAPISHGSSGGPVVNIKGELIGVTTFFYYKTPRSQNLNFAFPAEHIQNLNKDKTGRMLTWMSDSEIRTRKTVYVSMTNNGELEITTDYPTRMSISRNDGSINMQEFSGWLSEQRGRNKYLSDRYFYQRLENYCKQNDRLLR